MPERSAGILLYRRGPRGLEVLLAHWGGPYWARKDVGAWSIPKGVIEHGESEEQAARREFREELGAEAIGDIAPLPAIRQRAGKIVHAFALEGDFDPADLSSIDFTMEWPPRSGQMQAFPEVDRAEWFDLPRARAMMLPGQLPLLDALEALLSEPPAPSPVR